jgi:hypothetical protein
MGHAEHLHGWWAPGEGIDQWTFGVPVGIPGLDLSSLGAGPSWTLAGGTVLAVAAAIVPALFVRPAARPVLQRAQLFRALPYVILLAVGAALVTGELRIDNTGDGSSREMLLAAVGAGLIATLAAVVVPQRQFWRHATPAAIAAGLVTVSGLNPGAMASTKWAAFGAAAGVAVVAALTARRPRLALLAPHASEPATQPTVHL